MGIAVALGLTRSTPSLRAGAAGVAIQNQTNEQCQTAAGGLFLKSKDIPHAH